jgi:hypothetical protein
MENRDDYTSEKGKAMWWSKDGAWHIALPEAGRVGLFWTATQYASRDEAIKAINEQEGLKQT